MDLFVLGAPFYFLVVIALFGFVGCNWFYGLDPTKPIEPPDPPANFHLVAGDNQVEVLWDIDPEADRYNVFRAEMSGTIADDYPVSTGLSQSQLPYTDHNVSNGKTYFYRVSVKKDNYESELSQEELAMPMSPFGSFITGIATPGSPNPAGRAGWFGMAVSVVGPGSITIQKLGRAFDLGMATAHRLRIIDASSKMELGSTSVDINSPTGGYNDQFKYGDLNPPVPRAPGEDFYVLSEEFNNGDRFYEQDETVSTRAEARIMSAMESDTQGVTYTPANGIGHTYGPVDFQY